MILRLNSTCMSGNRADANYANIVRQPGRTLGFVLDMIHMKDMTRDGDGPSGFGGDDAQRRNFGCRSL